MTVLAGRLLAALLTASAVYVVSAAPARAAIPPEQEYWQLLVSRYQASSENYAEPLLEEFGVFRSLYPRSERGDSLAWLTGTLHEHRDNEPAALASYLELLYVYPASPLAEGARERLHAIAESRRRGITALFADDELELLKDHVLDLLAGGIATEGGERGYFEFLLLLADAGVKDLAGWTVDRARHYLYLADYSYRGDRVCVAIGDMQQLLGKWRSALLAYRSAAVVDPYGGAVSLALLRAGEVYLGPLENYEMARRTLNEVVERFPASMDAARAALLLAEVELAEENPAEAVVRLEDAAARFPFPEIRIEAWERAARIYRERLEDPAKAAAYYEKIVEEYPDQNRSAEALIELGRLHEERTKNVSAAVDAYARISELFPDSPLARRYLLRAAELAEDQLKDADRADRLYRELASSYPETEEGRKAADRIE